MLALLAGKVLGLLQRILDVAIGAPRLRLLQTTLRVLQALERGGRLRADAC